MLKSKLPPNTNGNTPLSKRSPLRRSESEARGRSMSNVFIPAASPLFIELLASGVNIFIPVPKISAGDPIKIRKNVLRFVAGFRPDELAGKSAVSLIPENLAVELASIIEPRLLVNRYLMEEKVSTLADAFGYLG